MAGVTPTDERPRTIVVVSGGVSEPSTTRLLADRLAQKTLDLLAARKIETAVRTVELRGFAADVAQASVTGYPGERLRPVVDQLAAADAVVAATPIYKAGISGLFKSFFDVLDDDLLIAKPIALVATAGSARHALVPDDQLRPLFAYFRALATPTSLFAAPEDWADPALTDRITRVAMELSALIASDVAAAIVGDAWRDYRHEFGSAAQRPDSASAVDGIDLTSDLMRLAAGGKPPPEHDS